MKILLIDIVIPGPPVEKQRHRTSQGRTYSPQSAIEEEVKRRIKLQLDADFQISNKPLIVAIDAYFPRPKGHYGTGKNKGKLKTSAPVYHMQTPDHDNVLKFYLDAMNQIVYEDDHQVVAFDTCGKLWTQNEGQVRIRICELSQ